MFIRGCFVIRKVLLAVLLASHLAPVVGCRVINKEITKIIYQKKPKESIWHSSAMWKYTLTKSQMQEIDFASSVSIEDVNVHYQQGLEAQADYIANKTIELLSEVEKKTGVQISFGTRIYLLRLDEFPQSFDIEMKGDPNEFCQPLFVEAGNESCEAIISKNWTYPGLLTHELVECSLIFPEHGGRILIDPHWSWLLFSGNYRNYTRWFREGFANYAGYLTSEIISQDMDLFQQPFSSLNKVGKKLFSWHQYSNDKLNHDYYNAALGLFLLIRDQFGEEAIREIIDEIKKQEYLDGVDLIKLTNQILNTDIKKLVENFHFPEIGLKTQPLKPATALNEGLDVTDGLFIIAVEPNSPADNANIKKKDVILKINGKPIKNNLDFELAIFELMQQQSVEVLLWRKEQQQITTELRLENVN